MVSTSGSFWGLAVPLLYCCLMCYGSGRGSRAPALGGVSPPSTHCGHCGFSGLPTRCDTAW